ncbi:MAG: hypothetical protein AAF986_06945 [Pseudomonadota bacterium]
MRFLSFVASLALGMTACGPAKPEMNLLDAADLFRAHGVDLIAIEQSFPGPYSGFFRIPARSEEQIQEGEEALIQQVRRNLPVEFIDFFPLGDTGKDEVNVILKRFSGKNGWTIISLVYSEIPLPPPEDKDIMAVYDKCDQRAADWVNRQPNGKTITAFCRLSDKWYAYQSVR